MVRRWVLTLLALLALAPFLVLATHAKKGGKPPPEPPPPADPAITYVSIEEVWVVNADGTNETIVYEEESNYMRYPSWSGDGEHIAFTKLPWGAGSEGELWRVDVDVVDGVPVGSSARVLVDDVYAEYPAWSPQNGVIAFTVMLPPWGDPGSTSRRGRELRLVPAGGGTQQILYAAQQGDYISRGKSWSPDGARIAFCERIEDVWYVRILTVATGAVTTPVELPRSEGHHDFAAGLDWARTDDLLAYTEITKHLKKNKKDYYYVYSVRTLDLDTGEATTVTTGFQGPSWSPDDSKLSLWHVASSVRVYDFASGVTETLDLIEKGIQPDWRR